MVFSFSDFIKSVYLFSMENKQSFEYALSDIEKKIANDPLMRNLQKSETYADILRALLIGASAADHVVDAISNNKGLVDKFSVSFKHNSFGALNYDRYEFFGDAIIGSVICEYLIYAYPNWNQHQLTLVKHQMVSSRYLGNYFIKPSGLLEFLVPKYSEIKNQFAFQGEKGLEKYEKIPGDVMESIVGGLYVVVKAKYGDVTAGVIAKNLILTFLNFAPHVEPEVDAKTQYKEIFDKNIKLGRLSDMTQQSIDERDGKTYKVVVHAINPNTEKKELMGLFSSKNKDTASSEAFKLALTKLKANKKSWNLK